MGGGGNFRGDGLPVHQHLVNRSAGARLGGALEDSLGLVLPGLAGSPPKRRAMELCRKLNHRGVNPTHTDP